MKKAELILKNPRTEKLKTVSTGYSWSVLLFCFLVPLYHRNLKQCLLFLTLWLCTLGAVSPILGFYYNRLYGRSLIKKGYKLFHIQGQISQKQLEKILPNNLG